jgi:hypothetical protein
LHLHRGIQALVDNGVLREITGKARNRISVYQRLIEILNEA